MKSYWLWLKWHVLWPCMMRSTRARERLTCWEQCYVRDQLRCPDCRGELVGGPEGGCSKNYCCKTCHSEFNLTILVGAALGERISDRGPRKVGDRAWCYPGVADE